MKKNAIPALAAAALLCAAAPAASADALMNFRVDARQTAVSTDTLAKGDLVTPGNVFIDNYSGISQMRLILKSDAPLVIENGDFVREEGVLGPDRNPKLALFNTYSTAVYTQNNAETGRTNVAVLYGEEAGEAGGGYYAAAGLDHADSALLQFDLRILQNTPVGDYICCISTDVRQIAGGLLTDEDSYIYFNRQQLTLDTDFRFTPLTFSVYRRGDVNCDGTVALEDAQRALSLYVTGITGLTPGTDELKTITGTDHVGAAQRAADASEDGNMSLEDAQGILLYYVESITGTTPDWTHIFS